MALQNIPLDPATIAAVVGFLTALGGSYRHYKRTGRIPLSQLPLKAFMNLFYALRVQFATKGRAPKQIQLAGTLEEVTDQFAKNSYEPKWPLSYHYHGEDENLRRYFYDPSKEYPHRQMHIRLWEDEDGNVSEYAHEEPSALHHLRAHIKSKNMNGATEWVAESYSKEGGRSLTLDPQHFSVDE